MAFGRSTMWASGGPSFTEALPTNALGEFPPFLKSLLGEKSTMKSLKNWPAMMAAIAASLLISGCSTVRYEYFPPASEQGRMCITHCQGIREVCRGNEINRTQSERHACEQRSESVFRNCQRHANNRDEAKKCYRPCLQRL